MTPQELLNRISTLSTEQQNAVAEFVTYLEEKKTPSFDTRAVIDGFMDEHAELMRLLAQ
ncbi:MAG TPA: hypothetical protein VHA33_30090 [Candidatus Angelobacter sp.]|jgi:hypothetical protein|nr:hypothetical protein [Candidatus Angelobacter sp.]